MVKAFISGCAGTRLSPAEGAFFAAEQPWGLILFKRNCSDRDQIPALVEEFRAAVGRSDAPVLIDCVNGWLAGTMAAAGCWDAGDAADADDDAAAERLAVAVDDLVDAWSATGGRVIAVTNEVGMALVPTTRAGRWFTEELGSLNQALAATADEVWQLTAGIATRLR